MDHALLAGVDAVRVFDLRHPDLFPDPPFELFVEVGLAFSDEGNGVSLLRVRGVRRADGSSALSPPRLWSTVGGRSGVLASPLDEGLCARRSLLAAECYVRLWVRDEEADSPCGREVEAWANSGVLEDEPSPGDWGARRSAIWTFAH